MLGICWEISSSSGTIRPDVTLRVCCFFLPATNSEESKNESPPPESNNAKDERPAGTAEHPVAGDSVVSLQLVSFQCNGPRIVLWYNCVMRTASARAHAFNLKCIFMLRPDLCCYQSTPSCQKKSSISVSTCLDYGPVKTCNKKISIVGVNNFLVASPNSSSAFMELCENILPGTQYVCSMIVGISKC